jgi:hypothetical protein
MVVGDGIGDALRINAMLSDLAAQAAELDAG